jgi:hypothetical protein
MRDIAAFNGGMGFGFFNYYRNNLADSGITFFIAAQNPDAHDPFCARIIRDF